MQSSPAYSWLGGSQGSSSGLIVKKTMKVDIPVDKYPTVSVLFPDLYTLELLYIHRGFILLCLFPQYNFVGRILGPRGNSLKRVEANTDCRVLIRGRGSIKDPARVKFRSVPLNLVGLCHSKPDQPLLGNSGYFIVCYLKVIPYMCHLVYVLTWKTYRQFFKIPLSVWNLKAALDY